MEICSVPPYKDLCFSAFVLGLRCFFLLLITGLARTSAVFLLRSSLFAGFWSVLPAVLG